MAEADSINWPAAFVALSELDGDAWDAQAARLTEQWKAEYKIAFVEVAVARGWSRENAETWPDEIVDEAYLSKDEHDWSPWAVASFDVPHCEEPA